jgi:O-antigen/teichoic acid export membrane protein
MMDHRVHSRFGSMSLLGFSKGVAALVFMLPLAWLAGVPGLAAGMTLASLVAAVAFGRRSAFDPPQIDLPGFLRQAAQGLPLSSVPFFNTMLSSVGPIVAAAVLGLEATGFYGLGVMIGTAVYAVPRALGLVLYPRYLSSYATDDPARIGNLLRRSLNLTTVLTTAAVCGAAILLRPLYEFVFPKYLPALNSNYALLAMMPFLAYALVVQNALLALRLHSRLITIQIVCVLLSAVLSFLGARLTGDVTWMAVGVMAANMVYGIAAMWLALTATAVSDRRPALEFLRELQPIALMGLPTLAMITLWKPTGDLTSQILVCAAQLLLMAPVLALYAWPLWRSFRASDR